MIDLEKFDFYNPDIKERFIKTYDSEQTQTLYAKTFQKISEIENEKGKDLFDFNINELHEMLARFGAKTLKSLTTTLSIANRYDDWAVTEGYVQTNINAAKFVSKDELKQYVSKLANQEQYITKDELYRICDSCLNSQDAVILALSFVGLRGELGSEITSLKVGDVDFDNNKIIVRDELGNIKRTINVDYEVIKIIDDAIKQTMYMKKIKDENNPPKSPKEGYDLEENEYVVRQAIRIGGKTKTHLAHEPANWQIVGTRIKKVAKNVDKPYLTATTLYQSGMFDMLRRIKSKKDELTTEDYKDVIEYYGGNRDSYYGLKELFVTATKQSYELKL